MAAILQTKNESLFFCCVKARKVYSMSSFILQRRDFICLSTLRDFILLSTLLPTVVMRFNKQL